MNLRTSFIFNLRNLLLYNRALVRLLKMPVYAVIFNQTKSGAIASNWDQARSMRDASKNSYAKKCENEVEAVKYIRNLKYEVCSQLCLESTNNTKTNLKRKHVGDSNISVDSVKKNIVDIKTAFNNLQVSMSSLSGLTANYVEQIKLLNDEVNGKLRCILQNYEIENMDEESLVVPSDKKSFDQNLAFDDEMDHSDLSILNFQDPKLLPSQIEAAKKKFTFNAKHEVVVYTDGACSQNGYKGASAGAGVWFGNCHPLNVSIKVPGAQTNNNAEIFSTIKAIDYVKATGLSKINIHTDSDFVIKSINEWMKRWLKNGWKTSNGTAVKNKEMLTILNQKIQSMDSVNWTYVPGHKGITGNEEADKLAKMGAKM